MKSNKQVPLIHRDFCSILELADVHIRHQAQILQVFPSICTCPGRLEKMLGQSQQTWSQGCAALGNQKEELDGQRVINTGIDLPIGLFLSLHTTTTVRAYSSFVLVETTIRESLALEQLDSLDEFGIQRDSQTRNHSPVSAIFVSFDFDLHCFDE